MQSLYEILIEYILPIFIKVDTLGEDVTIFKTLFVLVASIIIVWLFLYLPFKICQKIMRWDKIKGGKGRR